ncbi:hypothetical protein JA9_003819 [Meyerozyma sp. JA9]|nr:hypothetical protein JA9_003819 [Meyerozyma sp. JA9]
MYEQYSAPNFERRNSQQTVINESITSQDSQSFPLTDMSSSSTVYRSLYAEQMSHLTNYANKLAQYANTDVMLIVVREEPSSTNLSLPQKNIFTFASLKLQPLLARIEKDPRFIFLTRTGGPPNPDLSVVINTLSLVLLAFSLLSSLIILGSVLAGIVISATMLVSSISLLIWGRVMTQRKSPTKYQPLEDEMDQEPPLHGSHKENRTSGNLLDSTKRGEITNLEAAMTSVACDISTNGTKILFHLESEGATSNYGSSELKSIFGQCQDIFSMEENEQGEPQTAIRNLDKRMDYWILCLIFSTIILFDIMMYFKWYTVENIEVFGVSSVYCMFFDSIFAVRLLYMYSNGIE